MSKCRKKNISLNWSKSGYLELKVWLPRMEHLEEQFSESLSISWVISQCAVQQQHCRVILLFVFVYLYFCIFVFLYFCIFVFVFVYFYLLSRLPMCSSPAPLSGLLVKGGEGSRRKRRLREEQYRSCYYQHCICLVFALYLPCICYK